MIIVNIAVSTVVEVLEIKTDSRRNEELQVERIKNLEGRKDQYLICAD